MGASLLTIAGTMFVVPLMLLTIVALVGDIPGWMLKVGGWTMAFSLIVAAMGILVTMNQK